MSERKLTGMKREKERKYIMKKKESKKYEKKIRERPRRKKGLRYMGMIGRPRMGRAVEPPNLVRTTFSMQS